MRNACVNLNAEEVAAQLYAAQDIDSIQSTLRQIYDYLNVGFLTPESRNTAKKGAFSIYDFQSEILAQRYIDRWIFPIDRLASFIGSVGVVNLNTGEQPSANELLELLVKSITYSRKDKSLFTFRLIDKLGMAKLKPLDLAKQDLSPSTTYLDSIQAFLFLHSFLSVVDAAGALPRDITNPTQSLSLKMLNGPKPNIIDIKSEAFKQKYGTKAAIATALTDSLQDAFIALGYVITIEPTAVQTHWKHSEGEDDKEITLKASVVWDLGKAGETLSRWSREKLGYETNIPDPGPQKDATVEWYADNLLVPKNGHFQEGINSGKTDANGVATITFVPNTEKRPGQGPSKQDTGTIMAQVRFRSCLDPRKVFELLTIGPENNYAYSRLFVEHHQNITLEISRTVVAPGVNFHYDNIRVPLSYKRPDALQLEGNGTMIYTISLTDGSLIGGGAEKINVKATNIQNTAAVHFEISSESGTGSADLNKDSVTGSGIAERHGNKLTGTLETTSDGETTTGTYEVEGDNLIGTFFGGGHKTTVVVDGKKITGTFIDEDGNTRIVTSTFDRPVTGPPRRKVAFDLPAENGTSYTDTVPIPGVDYHTDYKLLLEE